MGQNGQPTGSFTIPFSKADKSISLVYAAYPLSADAKMRRRIIVENSSLVTKNIINIGTHLVIDYQQLTVISINDEGCGVACLMINKDFIGLVASEMKIYLGFKSK